MAHESRHLVVDGSNIATESRTLPSLAQLDEAVRAVHAEDPDRQITVIVDATFSHRIDPSEKKAFEEASDNGEILVPPAGAVGRGDAFILQVAEKADAAVLSNDSFQEFHGEHPWLFDEGRLIGGKPVEGIGWVFVPRVPVRGPASRRATRGSKDDRSSGRGRSAKSTKRSRGSRSPEAAAGPPPTPSADNPPPAKKARRSSGRSTDRRKGDRRDEVSRERAKKTSDDTPAKRGRGRSDRSNSGPTDGGRADSAGTDASNRRKKDVEELNSTSDFLKFVTQHSIGDDVEAVVERFSSHGCYVRASGAQCYLPSAAMGDPPPNRARDVVSDGQTIIVKVESIDSDRRGINVVLVRTIADGAEQDKPAAGRSRRGRQGKTSQQPATAADERAREANPTRSDTTVATKKTAKKARKRPAAKKTTKKAPAKATTSARATKATARRAAKKTTKKGVAKKAPAKKATAKKAPAKKTTAKKTTKKTTTKKAPAKKAPAKKATAKKATAKKAPAKKATKKATAKKAPTKTSKKTTKKTTRKATAKKR